MNLENLQLQFGDIPTIENVEFKKVEPSYKKVLLYNWTLIFIVLLAVAILLFCFVPKLKYNSLAITITIASFVTCILVVVLWLNVEFKYRSYAIRQKDVLYKTGWLIQKTHAVAYNKIQHCSVIQGFIAKKFGLADLKIFTAAGFSYDITIRGLKFENAEALKDWIMQQNKL